MLDKIKFKWVDELPQVLWVYRTMPRRSTGETPFFYAACFGGDYPPRNKIPDDENQLV